MIEIEPKEMPEKEIDSASAVDDSGSRTVPVPQEALEYFNIKPEDNISYKETERLVGIWNMAKELFPEGNTAAILNFIRAVERQNPSYMASEQDRLFNVYKQFRIGTYNV